MTHKGRILADRILAVPLAFLFNGAARFLGRVLRRDHSVTSENVKVIVVAKLIGMGSILQCAPLLRALKQRYPNAKLVFVTMRSNRELLSRLSSVDEIVVMDDRSMLSMAATTLRTIATLIRLRADFYFDLEVYSGFASLLALWAMTRNRLGFYRHSTAFKKGIYTHLVYFNTRMPVRQLYLQLGRVAGIPAGQSELLGPILVHDRERSEVSRLLAESSGWQPEQPYIAVNPNASDLLLERRWPTESVLEAISRLVSLGNQVVLIGAPNEAGFVKSLFDKLAPEVQVRVAQYRRTAEPRRTSCAPAGRGVRPHERYRSDAHGDCPGTADGLPVRAREPRTLRAGLALRRYFLRAGILQPLFVRGGRTSVQRE